MKVGLALEIDVAIDEMSNTVSELNSALKEYFRSKQYGSDVANIFIGVLLTGPGSERLHPVRALEYRKRVRFTLPKMEFHNVVEYDVKPDFELFSQLGPGQARQYLARLLVESIDIMKKQQNKFPNFDVCKFERDLKACLQT